MAEVGGVGGDQVASLLRGGASEQASGPVNQPNAQGFPDVTGGRLGPLGQPPEPASTSLPAQPKILPDALALLDPAQVAAAERALDLGGASATDILLGLNWQPSVLGAFAPPPGNVEALRHLSPAMRGAIMRDLIARQRKCVQHLERLLRAAQRGSESDGYEEPPGEGAAYEDALAGPEREGADTFGPLGEAQAERAWRQLESLNRMLDLLGELMAMQDSALSQMGTLLHG